MRAKHKKRFVAFALICTMIGSAMLPAKQAKAAVESPVVRYDMSVENGKLKDVSGNGYDAELVGLSAANVITDQAGEKAMQFNGSGYVKLPDFLNQNQNTITIQMTYKIGNTNNEGLLTLGSKNASTSGNNYLRFHPNQDATTFLWESEVNNQNNARTYGNVTYSSEEYATVTAVITEDCRLAYYLNGRKYGTMNMNGVSVQDILNSSTDRSDTIGYIGRPAWADHDPYFSGVLKSFEVYDYAIPEEEILGDIGSNEGSELIVKYDMSVEGGKLKDVSGNGNDAALVGLSASNVKTDADGSKVLQFNGSGYVKLPDFLNNNENTITINMVYQIGRNNNEGLLTLGSKNASTSGNNYLRFHPNQDSTTFLWESEVNNQNNAKVTGNVTYVSGEYATATAVISADSTLTYYLNGKKYGTLNMNSVTLQDVLNTCDNRSDTIGYIGRPAWANHDPYFSGVLKSFEVYNYAMPEEEILWNTRTGLDPVVDYEMTLTKDGKLKDNSGFGLHANLVGLDANAFVEDNGKKVLDFANTGGYIEIPKEAIQGEEFTIEAYFQIDKTENSAIWTLGTKLDGPDYARLHPVTQDGLLLELNKSWSANKLGINDETTNIVSDDYNMLTTVFYEKGLIILYLNGEEIGRLEHDKKIEDILRDGVDKEDIVGYIGRSIWTSDPKFTGKLAGFRVYERALTSDEVFMNSIPYENSASLTRIVSNVEPKNVAGATTAREWRESMVTGNGNNGALNAGYPYSDTITYQNMYLLMPSTSTRENTDFYWQLDTVRQAVINMNESAIPQIGRSFFYAHHPGPQLRLDMDKSLQGEYSNYERWTDFETAEVGVSYTNRQGSWERKTFTSREDDVTITQITKSSTGSKIDMEISLDNLSKLPNFSGDPTNMQYKKIVADDASYIALVGKYPGTGGYANGELKNGGYVGTAQVIVVGGTKEKVLNTTTSRDSQNVGTETDPRIKITGADAVYIIERTDRTFDMCTNSQFRNQQDYALLNELNDYVEQIVSKYGDENSFDYEAALAPHAKKHGDQFNTVKFSLNVSEEERATSTDTLLATQKSSSSLSDALVERVYNAGRYVELCCSGYSTPRLGGMWTGEWNPGGWRNIYTMDANVNIQVSPMNTGNMKDAPLGYINFVLRQLDDWMENAYMSYRMHDAIQPSVNTDGNSSIGIESDWLYPFQYWNSGASWMILPIYEYWQCYGNQQIPISDTVDLYEIRGALGVEDGGLSVEEVDALMERGWLDLEKDILMPLLIKQANFWEQLMTPEYYMDANGNPHYQKGKTELNVAAGEKYMIIPTYSPENAPRQEGSYTWNYATTMNATMDIAAAKDGLAMTMVMEEVVKRDGYEEAIERWSTLQSLLPEYQYDGEPGSAETYYGGGGALREWATPLYMEENRHRHISHMYVAWPAYETQHDEALQEAALQSLKNRNRLNSGGEKTTGHGWMHFALVQARLKNAPEVYSSLYDVLKSDIYYSSMVTDHNTNRGSNTYCTDTSIGIVGVINEALLFSNTGEIELLPAIPQQWTTGSMDGLVARTRAQVEKMSWNLEEGTVDAVIHSDIDQEITLTCGTKWGNAVIEGNRTAQIKCGEFIKLKMKADETVTIHFNQDQGTDTMGELPFIDVTEDDWFYEAVYYNYVEGLMTGKSETIFAPEVSLSRAEFASVLYAANELPDVTYEAVFSDIAEYDWYADAVIWANKEGIVNGYGSGLFGPTDPVAREQMAIMMYNYALAKGYATDQRNDLSAFKDAGDVSWYAEEAMQWAVGAGVITGKDGGTRLDPYGATSRAECAAIMQKFMENCAK